MVSVKKLPEGEVKKRYNQYLSDAETVYDFYSAAFESKDEFMIFYFGVTGNESWQDFVRAKAEEAVTERLVLFYIIDKEGIAPVGAEFDKLYNECVNEYKAYYENLDKAEIDACTTEEEKAAKLKEIEDEMFALYGEQYFRELAYYKYAVEILLGYAQFE